MEQPVHIRYKLVCITVAAAFGFIPLAAAGPIPLGQFQEFSFTTAGTPAVGCFDNDPNGKYLHDPAGGDLPTLGEAMDQALTADEQAALVAELRPLVEEGRGVWRMAHAYLWAEKP